MRPITLFQLLLALVVFINFYGVDAIALGNRFQALMGGRDTTNNLETDLTELLTSHVHTDPETFKQAKVYVASLQAASTCHRVAAEDLIDSCRSPSHPINDDDHVQQLRSLYAARLAICETQEAGIVAPSDCSHLFSPKALPEDANHGGFSQLRFSETYGLNRCLAALEKRTQSWTSYSNNRQQSAVICQAVRAHVEQTQLLNLHRNLIVMQEGVSEALAQQLERALARTQEEREFLKAIYDLQGSIAQDLGNYAADTKEHMALIAKEFEVQVSGIFSKVNVVVGAFGGVFATATDRLHGLINLVDQTYFNIISSRADLAAMEAQQAEQSQTMTVALHNSLVVMQREISAMGIELYTNRELTNQVAGMQLQMQEYMNTMYQAMRVYIDESNAMHNQQTAVTLFNIGLAGNLSDSLYSSKSVVDSTLGSVVDLNGEVAILKEHFGYLTTFAEPLRMLSIFMTKGAILFILWQLRHVSVQLSWCCIICLVIVEIVSIGTIVHIPNVNNKANKERALLYLYYCAGMVFVVTMFLAWQVSRGRCNSQQEVVHSIEKVDVEEQKPTGGRVRSFRGDRATSCPL